MKTTFGWVLISSLLIILACQGYAWADDDDAAGPAYRDRFYTGSLSTVQRERLSLPNRVFQSMGGANYGNYKDRDGQRVVYETAPYSGRQSRYGPGADTQERSRAVESARYGRDRDGAKDRVDRDRDRRYDWDRDRDRDRRHDRDWGRDYDRRRYDGGSHRFYGGGDVSLFYYTPPSYYSIYYYTPSYYPVSYESLYVPVYRDYYCPAPVIVNRYVPFDTGFSLRLRW